MGYYRHESAGLSGGVVLWSLFFQIRGSFLQIRVTAICDVDNGTRTASRVLLNILPLRPEPEYTRGTEQTTEAEPESGRLYPLSPAEAQVRQRPALFSVCAVRNARRVRVPATPGWSQTRHQHRVPGNSSAECPFQPTTCRGFPFRRSKTPSGRSNTLAHHRL